MEYYTTDCFEYRLTGIIPFYNFRFSPDFRKLCIVPNSIIMNIITDMERWGNSHRPGFLDLFRVILGLFITYKGLYFITNIGTLEITTQGLNASFAGINIAHYVAFAHILGGPMILLGVYTRFACLIQLPILIGAVFLVNAPKGFLSLGQHMELWISVIVLLGLVTFIIFGAGRFSVDNIRRRDAEAHLEHH